MVRFQINKSTIAKEISTQEYEALEMAQDGDAKVYRLRPLVARFMVDDNGLPIPHAQAVRELGKLPLEEFLQDVVTAFTGALMETAIPKANGTQLRQPSEQVTQILESPAGSQP
jgi:hypothetical protein